MSVRLSHPFFLILLLTMSFSACKKNENISGKEFLEREVLVDILVDIHLADGVSNDRVFHRKFAVDSIDVLSPILDKYEVSRQKFDTTLLVYTHKPQLLDQVYNDVMIKLNVMLDENSKEKKEDEEANTPELSPEQFPSR